MALGQRIRRDDVRPYFYVGDWGRDGVVFVFVLRDIQGGTLRRHNDGVVLPRPLTGHRWASFNDDIASPFNQDTASAFDRSVGGSTDAMFTIATVHSVTSNIFNRGWDDRRLGVTHVKTCTTT